MADQFRELGRALDRLLIMKQGADLRALNQDIIQAKLQLELERDNYVESKRNAQKWEDAVETITEQFGDTGVSLDLLNKELGDHSEAYSVLDSLNKLETTSYSERAKYYNTKADVYKERYQTIDNVMDNQIGLAKKIQQGGIIKPVLGDSPDQWDIEDITEPALRRHLGLKEGEPTPEIAKAYFESNPQLTNENLMKLTRELSTQTYYDDRNQSKKEADLKAEGTSYFNRRLINAKTTSAFDQILVGEALLDPGNKELFEETYTTEQQRQDYENNIILLTGKFGVEFGTMIGAQDATENPAAYYNQYKILSNQASYETQKRIAGAIAEPDYTAYNIAVQQTYENYLAKDTKADKEIIVRLAQKYLGMPPNMSMEEFMNYHNKFYSAFALSGFQPSSIITDPSDTEEDTEFDDIYWEDVNEQRR